MARFHTAAAKIRAILCLVYRALCDDDNDHASS